MEACPVLPDITIGNITIGDNHPVVVIAEAACQHNGDMDVAKRLADAAKVAGADIVKFQLHVAEVEMVVDHELMQFWAGSMKDVLDRVNIESPKAHAELKAHCELIGIQYLCTPFCSAAADNLEKVGVAAYKTGSGELTNLPMLRHIAKKGKPMIVSTGMSTMDEIGDAVAVLREEGIPFMLTHCLSEYPAGYEHMNLRLIPELRRRFGVMVGWSDHSTEVYAPVAAVALGARVVEKHFTLADVQGPDDIVSLDPAAFRVMVDAIRKTEAALGNERSVSKEEQPTRNWAHHSVVAARDIRKGEVLTTENLVPKRPGNGIPASYLDPLHSAALLGKRAAHDLLEDAVLDWKSVA